MSSSCKAIHASLTYVFCGCRPIPRRIWCFIILKQICRQLKDCQAMRAARYRDPWQKAEMLPPWIEHGTLRLRNARSTTELRKPPIHNDRGAFSAVHISMSQQRQPSKQCLLLQCIRNTSIKERGTHISSQLHFKSLSGSR